MKVTLENKQEAVKFMDLPEGAMFSHSPNGDGLLIKKSHNKGAISFHSIRIEDRESCCTNGDADCYRFRIKEIIVEPYQGGII